MDTQLLDAIRSIIREEVRTIVREEVHQQLKSALKPIHTEINHLNKLLSVIIEGQDTLRVHRRELNDHNERISIVEARIPIIS